MFGMNQRDAQFALEDVLIGQNARASMEARLGAREDEENARVFEQCTLKIRQQRAMIETLQKQLQAVSKDAQDARERSAQLSESRNEAIASLEGAAQALKTVTAELAEAKSQPVDELEKVVKVRRTRFYNQTINRYLQEGYLTQDPRVSEKVTGRPWYVPGLDPDHGV